MEIAALPAMQSGCSTLPAPLCQQLFNFACDLTACIGAVHTACQQLIVGNMWLWRTAPTARVSAFSSRFRPASERPTRPLSRTAVCSAAAATSAARQLGEHLRNQLGHLRNQFAVLFATLHYSPCPCCCLLVGVLNAFLLGL
ncbi:MAG: hypothetical protein WCA10_00605 [Terracidiphilus sp.]